MFLSLATSDANTPFVENGISSVKKQSLCSGIKVRIYGYTTKKISNSLVGSQTKKFIYKPCIICAVNLIPTVKEVPLINDKLLKLRCMKFEQFFSHSKKINRADYQTIRQATADSAQN